ncbi:hypothetical protein CA51_50590 [Rosistilla oblonga]|uniref:Uncharacterized protein n=1 Tax=Rosistilla oblonga TaxID=2527990 RepID=A0A518IUD5_9BACT|nr:hypothetical protein [Rosistilla oblonga]QDV15147.1 hypothetical protein CA51_50590 [Rosistilla oblonga]QDV56699.1 hypothetical protein Mal33_26970 [Rosistilla oblonga]
MIRPTYMPGDWVVYRKSKTGPLPGPHAQQVHPSPKGEQYSYVVEKYWVVKQVFSDGRLLLKTRRGREHIIDSADPGLRLAGFLRRWMHRDSYTIIEKLTRDSGSSPTISHEA